MSDATPLIHRFNGSIYDFNKYAEFFNSLRSFKIINIETRWTNGCERTTIFFVVNILDNNEIFKISELQMRVV